MARETSPGLIRIYTGNGKGKTTAALGLALRAAGQGKKVIIIQFVKGAQWCGEHIFTSKYHPFEIVQPNPQDSFTQSRQELYSVVQQTLAYAAQVMLAADYDIVIWDEIFIAISLGLITTREVLDLMREKPESVELVLTGRNAPPEIIQQADLVTEMVMIKHPFSKGIEARRGIEY